MLKMSLGEILYIAQPPVVVATSGFYPSMDK